MEIDIPLQTVWVVLGGNDADMKTNSYGDPIFKRVAHIPPKGLQMVPTPVFIHIELHEMHRK